MTTVDPDPDHEPGAGDGDAAAGIVDGDTGGVRARLAAVEVPLPAPEPGPPAGAGGAAAGADGPMVAPPRLARYELTLPSGREVGVALCGHGVPLVVIHGFGGEGILYAQTLSRLVRLGFLVVAIDAPGHGRTEPIPLWSGFERYTSLVTETLDHLGIERAVFVGHSMGGRVVAELAAAVPERVLAVMLVDAIVGDVWDRMVELFRLAPGLYAAFGLGLLADTAATLPWLANPSQALKLMRLLIPTGAGHVLRPWRMAGPVLTILTATSSGAVLDRLRGHGVATFVVHGDRDVLVPLCNARRAAVATAGRLVTVHGARHSWLLADPETFPALFAELWRGPLGEVVAADSPADAGDPEQVFCRPGAPVFALTPEVTPVPLRRRHRAARFRWTVSRPT